ncbi:phospho-N-acetylmuramoyl-pentapeptide-transferase [Candidatus Wolfebacteria bacterium]|nr:phospho-N-acetylmuramoyl-pentapeptide-transferase [Candidatus Wolfebacteria bacterium]
MYFTHAFLIVKNLSFFIISFAISLSFAPILIRFLYKYKCWKKKPRDKGWSGEATPVFTGLHGQKEINTPRMGGILIWGTILLIAAGTALVSKFLSPETAMKINFLSRSQTWLPLFTLISASILGLVDDLLVIRGKGRYVGGGLRFKIRLALIFLIGLIGAWWFYYKLGWSTIYIPFYGNIEINGLYLLLFILVVLATYSGGVVDGLDGLSAGVLLPIFSSFAVIAYSKNLYDLTVFISLILGALFTYLWFNIHPAKFYMGETGIMGLTVTLAVIAFLTNAALFLPIIAFVLVVESGSVILQILSKKIRGKKIFLSAPIHHHLEAIGWPETQITMRFWIISAAASGLGLVLFFLSKFL